jgi:hypothetical protein
MVGTDHCTRTFCRFPALFSLVAMLALQLLGEYAFSVRQAAWYDNRLPIFSGTLAFVRQYLWFLSFLSVKSRRSRREMW